MRICTLFLAMAFCTIAKAQTQDNGFGPLKELCRVSFPANTQAGPMKGTLSVCRLDSDTSLCVVAAYEREYGARILRLLELAHSPIMEMTGDRISILYTTGVNTTSVTEFSIAGGGLNFISTETIAWNDSGVWRKSVNFARFSHLYNEREKKLNQKSKPTPVGVAHL